MNYLRHVDMFDVVIALLVTVVVIFTVWLVKSSFQGGPTRRNPCKLCSGRGCKWCKHTGEAHNMAIPPVLDADAEVRLNSRGRRRTSISDDPLYVAWRARVAQGYTGTFYAFKEAYEADKRVETLTVQREERRKQAKKRERTEQEEQDELRRRRTDDDDTHVYSPLWSPAPSGLPDRPGFKAGGGGDFAGAGATGSWDDTAKVVVGVNTGFAVGMAVAASVPDYTNDTPPPPAPAPYDPPVPDYTNDTPPPPAPAPYDPPSPSPAPEPPPPAPEPSPSPAPSSND